MAEERGSACGPPLLELLGVSVSLPRARVDAHEPSGLLSGELGSRWVMWGAMSEASVASGLLSGAGPWARPSALCHGDVLTRVQAVGAMGEHVLSPGETQLCVCSASRARAWPSGAKAVYGFKEAHRGPPRLNVLVCKVGIIIAGGPEPLSGDCS